MLGFAKRQSASLDPSALLTVQRGPVLLADHTAILSSIRSIIGVPQQHWRVLYQALFTAFAEYVQRLPASEAHHHCEVGGLLRHALEVVELALKVRRGYVLPPGKEPEVVADQQDLWTYAVATAALLHDAGKPLIDQLVMLYSRDGLPLNVWSPWVGPMTTAGGSRYRVDFRRRGEHRAHEAVTPLLATHIVPKDGLRWLGRHHDALAAWLGAISGHTVGSAVIADIVKQADQLSVARDLTGERHQLPGARAKPLAERLLVALRQLLETGALPMNRQGGAAFVDGSKLWLVSKRCLDAIRESMQGQTGVPPDNDRLLDELQQRGIAVPRCDGQAVWTGEVRVGHGAEVWCQSLPLLCIPIDRVWAEPDARPAPAEVHVSMIDALDSDSPHGASPGVECVATARVEGISAAAMAGIPAAVVDTVDVNARNRQDSRPSVSGVDVGNPDPGTAFLNWLIDGLKRRALVINSPKAQVHVVDEGLLLVSPAIFRTFAGADWLIVQKRFLKRKLTAKTSNGENIFHYEIDSDRGKNTIKGLLIRDPQKTLAVSLPATNRLLSQKPYGK
jgi:integrating conjugative element relaxase (TIGR03760 family)